MDTQTIALTRLAVQRQRIEDEQQCIQDRKMGTLSPPRPPRVHACKCAFLTETLIPHQTALIKTAALHSKDKDVRFSVTQIVKAATDQKGFNPPRISPITSGEETKGEQTPPPKDATTAPQLGVEAKAKGASAETVSAEPVSPIPDVDSTPMASPEPLLAPLPTETKEEAPNPTPSIDKLPTDKSLDLVPMTRSVSAETGRRLIRQNSPEQLEPPPPAGSRLVQCAVYVEIDPTELAQKHTSGTERLIKSIQAEKDRVTSAKKPMSDSAFRDHIRRKVKADDMWPRPPMIDPATELKPKFTVLPHTSHVDKAVLEYVPFGAWPDSGRLLVCRTEAERKQVQLQQTRPNIHMFVSKRYRGAKDYYCYAVTMHQKLRRDQFQTVKFQQAMWIYALQEYFDCSEDFKHMRTVGPDDVYAPRSIVLISEYPYHESMLRFLREYFSSPELTEITPPVAQRVWNLFEKIALPKPGAMPLQLPLAREATIYPPDPDGPPVCDVNFSHVFRRLDANIIIRMLNHLCVEHSLLLVSNNIDVLTYAMECVRLLLCPVQWKFTYNSFVGPKYLRLLQSFQPFFFGALRSQLGKLESGLEHQYDILVVDVDQNIFTVVRGNSDIRSALSEAYWVSGDDAAMRGATPFPSTVAKNLRRAFSAVCMPQATRRSSALASVNKSRRLNRLAKLMRTRKFGVERKDRQYHLETYKDCFVGSDAVEWVMDQERVSRQVARNVCVRLFRRGIFTHTLGNHSFLDEHKFYKWTPAEILPIFMQMHTPGSGVQLTNDPGVKTYPFCFTGKAAADWMLREGKSTNRSGAAALLRMFESAHLIRTCQGGKHGHDDVRRKYHFHSDALEKRVPLDVVDAASSAAGGATRATSGPARRRVSSDDARRRMSSSSSSETRQRHYDMACQDASVFDETREGIIRAEYGWTTTGGARKLRYLVDVTDVVRDRSRSGWLLIPKNTVLQVLFGVDPCRNWPKQLKITYMVAGEVKTVAIPDPVPQRTHVQVGTSFHPLLFAQTNNLTVSKCTARSSSRESPRLPPRSSSDITWSKKASHRRSSTLGDELSSRALRIARAARSAGRSQDDLGYALLGSLSKSTTRNSSVSTNSSVGTPSETAVTPATSATATPTPSSTSPVAMPPLQRASSDGAIMSPELCRSTRTQSGSSRTQMSASARSSATSAQSTQVSSLEPPSPLQPAPLRPVAKRASKIPDLKLNSNNNSSSYLVPPQATSRSRCPSPVPTEPALSPAAVREQSARLRHAVAVEMLAMIKGYWHFVTYRPKPNATSSEGGDPAAASDRKGADSKGTPRRKPKFDTLRFIMSREPAVRQFLKKFCATLSFTVFVKSPARPWIRELCERMHPLPKLRTLRLILTDKMGISDPLEKIPVSGPYLHVRLHGVEQFRRRGKWGLKVCLLERPARDGSTAGHSLTVDVGRTELQRYPPSRNEAPLTLKSIEHKQIAEDELTVTWVVTFQPKSTYAELKFDGDITYISVIRSLSDAVAPVRARWSKAGFTHGNFGVRKNLLWIDEGCKACFMVTCLRTDAMSATQGSTPGADTSVVFDAVSSDADFSRQMDAKTGPCTSLLPLCHISRNLERSSSHAYDLTWKRADFKRAIMARTSRGGYPMLGLYLVSERFPNKSVAEATIRLSEIAAKPGHKEEGRMVLLKPRPGAFSTPQAPMLHIDVMFVPGGIDDRVSFRASTPRASMASGSDLKRGGGATDMPSSDSTAVVGSSTSSAMPSLGPRALADWLRKAGLDVRRYAVMPLCEPRVNLREHGLTNLHLEYIAWSLASPSCACRALDLSRNSFDIAGLRVLFLAIRKPTSSLTALNLSENNMGPFVRSPEFVDVLQHNAALTCLKLSSGGVDDKGAEALGRVLAANKSILWLDVADNDIHESGLAFLNKTLRSAESKLATLNLQGNPLGDQGIVKLSESLRDNTTLKSLNIRNTGFQVAGAAAVARMLLLNCGLRSLDISENRFAYKFTGDAGAVVDLMKALPENQTLISIDMSYCDLNSFELQTVARGVEASTTLRGLTLNQHVLECKIEHGAFQAAVVETLHRNELRHITGVRRNLQNCLLETLAASRFVFEGDYFWTIGETHVQVATCDPPRAIFDEAVTQVLVCYKTGHECMSFNPSLEGCIGSDENKDRSTVPAGTSDRLRAMQSEVESVRGTAERIKGDLRALQAEFKIGIQDIMQQVKKQISEKR